MELEPLGHQYWRVAEWDNADIWKRRVAGLPVSKIAEEFEISVEAVQEALQGYVDQRPVESDQVAKALEIDRLDALFGLACAMAEQGDSKALGMAVKISDSRRAFLGINAPDKREIAMTAKSELDEQIELMIAEMEDI